MNHRIDKLCAWSGLICVLLFFIALWSMGFMPPPSPSWSVERVVAHYQQHNGRVLFGVIPFLLAGMFYVAFVGVISGQMRRIPGVGDTPIFVQLAAGTLASTAFLVPAMLFAWAAFRPERPAEITYAVHDFAWIFTVMPWPPFLAQYFAFGAAVLKDNRKQPLFPRWYGYLCFWAPITFTPGAVLPFFKTGPFAWNGLIVFWFGAVVFGIWFMSTVALLLKAIDTAGEDAVVSSH